MVFLGWYALYNSLVGKLILFGWQLSIVSRLSIQKINVHTHRVVLGLGAGLLASTGSSWTSHTPKLHSAMSLLLKW